jgi:hypothetical protein
MVDFLRGPWKDSKNLLIKILDPGALNLMADTKGQVETN